MPGIGRQCWLTIRYQLTHGSTLMSPCPVSAGSAGRLARGIENDPGVDGYPDRWRFFDERNLLPLSGNPGSEVNRQTGEFACR